MKKILFVMLMAILPAVASYAQQAVGVNAVFAADSKNVGLGIKYQYYIADFIRLEPSGNFLFRKDGQSAYDLNMNAHFVFHLIDELNLYPLLGANLGIWKFSGISGDYNRLGLNCGAGLEYTFFGTTCINLEAKYVFAKDFDQPYVSAGIAYRF